MKIPIFFFAIILLLIICSTTKENYETILKNDEEEKLLQGMSMFHNIAEKYGLWYNISFGTLLGAVRHYDIIPWDDDIDLIVMWKDIDKLEKVLEQLKKSGYHIEKTWKLYRIYTDKVHFIDIFIINIENEKVIRCHTNKNFCKKQNKNEKWWWKDFDFSKNFIGNKKYHFGKLYLNGPDKPDDILKYWYGNDYLTSCKTHDLENHITKVTPKKIICGNLPKPQL